MLQLLVAIAPAGFPLLSLTRLATIKPLYNVYCKFILIAQLAFFLCACANNYGLSA